MKLFPSVNKLPMYVAALAVTGAVAYGTSLPASAEWDPTTLENTVATHSQQLEAQDARIGTLEGQTAANTAAISQVSAEVTQTVVAPQLEAAPAAAGQTVATPTPTPATTPAITPTPVVEVNLLPTPKPTPPTTN